MLDKFPYDEGGFEPYSDALPASSEPEVSDPLYADTVDYSQSFMELDIPKGASEHDDGQTLEPEEANDRDFGEKIEKDRSTSSGGAGEGYPPDRKDNAGDDEEPSEDRFLEEATPDDVQGLFDAIDVTLSLDDAMPQRPDEVLPDPYGIKGLEFYADPRNKVDLIPIGGLKRLTITRRADVSDRATVLRETYKPDLGPEAYVLEAFRLHKEPDGTPRMSMGSDLHLTEDELVTLDNFMAARELEEATGNSQVPSQTCRELIRQISSTRVNPIQSTDNY